MLLGKVFAAASVFALGLALFASPALAGRPVRFEGDVLRISYEHRGFFTQVDVHGHLLNVVVRAVDRTEVTEDGNPAHFGDIVTGDHVQVSGEIVRHHGDRAAVVAAHINIVNDGAATDGETVRIRGRVERLSCERHAFITHLGDREVVVLANERTQVFLRTRDNPIRFCEIPDNACFRASGQFQRRGGREFFLAQVILVELCP